MYIEDYGLVITLRIDESYWPAVCIEPIFKLSEFNIANVKRKFNKGMYYGFAVKKHGEMIEWWGWQAARNFEKDLDINIAKVKEYIYANNLS